MGTMGRDDYDLERLKAEIAQEKQMKCGFKLCSSTVQGTSEDRGAARQTDGRSLPPPPNHPR